MKTVLYEKKQDLGYITLNRPKQYNAISRQLLVDLAEALTFAQKDHLRCLILRGSSEKAFAAGADIAEMAHMQPKDAQLYAECGIATLKQLENFPSPVIAMVQGFVLGGGCEIALACDIRVASHSAIFSMPETSLGVIPGFGGTQRLARLIGTGRAKELIYTAKRIQAEEALAIGLVNHVIADEELFTFTETLANTIAQNAPIAIREAKQAINTLTPNDDDMKNEIQHFANCFTSSDQKEAMDAFLSRRPHKAFENK